MTSVLINICLVYTKTWEYDVEWYTDMFSFLKTGFKQSKVWIMKLAGVLQWNLKPKAWFFSSI